MKDTRESNFVMAAVRADGGMDAMVAKSVYPRIAESTVYRSLRRLVDAGALAKYKIVGRQEHAWFTTAAYAKTCGERPGVAKVAHGGVTFVPGPTWDHDQLAVATLYRVSHGATFATEHELATYSTRGVRQPDGAFLLRQSGKPAICVALEVELSRKTGLHGGWAQLAQKMLHRQMGFGEGIAALHSKANTTLLVAHRNVCESIERHVMRLLDGADGSDIWWLEMDHDVGYGIWPAVRVHKLGDPREQDSELYPATWGIK